MVSAQLQLQMWSSGSGSSTKEGLTGTAAADLLIKNLNLEEAPRTRQRTEGPRLRTKPELVAAATVAPSYINKSGITIVNVHILLARMNLECQSCHKYIIKKKKKFILNKLDNDRSDSPCRPT